MSCSGRGDCLKQIALEKYLRGTCMNCEVENYSKREAKDEDPTN